jgi:1,2-diacylglycerol-3-alpha-glucose alpha-1,2-glucosyltransferase
MKVCLYLEMEKTLQASGIASAIKNQRKALELNGVAHTSDLKDDFDILHINILGLKSLFLIRRMRRMGKKVVIHAHMTDCDFRNSYRFSNLIAPFLKKYLAYYYGQADTILCPSEYTRGVLLSYGIKKPIIPISNGIDLDRFQYSEDDRSKFRKEHGLSGVVPLCVGHMFLRKGIDTFINVARSVGGSFIWIGRRYKNIEEPEVSKLIEEAPKNLTFINYIDDIVHAYCGTDIFFFPSSCENQGIVILEAAACRKPLLIRDISVYDGWLTDGVDCLKAKTDKEFEEKLRMLISDEPLRNRLAEKAHDMSRRHSLKEVGAKLKGIYERILSSRAT